MDTAAHDLSSLHLLRELQARDRALAESLDQQAATSEVLRVISNSPTDVMRVFEAVAASVARLADAPDVVILKVEDGRLRHAASVGTFGRSIGAELDLPIDRSSICGVALVDRRVLHLADLAGVTGPELTSARAIQQRYGHHSMIAAPMLDGAQPLGTIAVLRREVRPFTERQLALVQTFADQVAIAIRNAQLIKNLGAEIEAHRRSKATIQALVEQQRPGDGALIGDSAALRRVREAIAQVAPTDSTVLIQGETGTGKELVARAVHAASTRRERPLIKLNCAALPRELVESELFGHEKGAFTGAAQHRRGRFELADGGTLLLDEVGDLPLEAQAKLLRVLQEREFERLGGTRTLRVDVRVIAATNRDLAALVSAGRFRADLYYRLNVFPITVPPLRERREDIARLIGHFTQKMARKLGRVDVGVSQRFILPATAYDWPGNIRELENLVERALIVSSGGPLDGSALLPQAPTTGGPQGGPPAAEGDWKLQAVERAHIRRVLDSVGWRVEGEGGAAARLGLAPSTLRGRLRALGIRRS
jgi:formate hydrogenlyase transcriptional activator